MKLYDVGAAMDIPILDGEAPTISHPNRRGFPIVPALFHYQLGHGNESRLVVWPHTHARIYSILVGGFNHLEKY
jgi:hypothetical protein